LRYLIHWGLRRDEENVCPTPACCPEAPAKDERCPACPLTRLDDAMQSWPGCLAPRAAELQAMLQAGFTIGPDDVSAEEWGALLILQEEQAKYEEEKRQKP